MTHPPIGAILLASSMTITQTPVDIGIVIQNDYPTPMGQLLEELARQFWRGACQPPTWQKCTPLSPRLSNESRASGKDTRLLPDPGDTSALASQSHPNSAQGFSKVRILEAQDKGTQIRANLAQMCADNNHL
jgi:hypothetical protein